MVRYSALSLFLILLLFAPLWTAEPQTPDASASPAKPQPETVIRSSARLVQMSVVVEDKKGNPVSGLKQEDFTVLDEGRPQQIAFFTAQALETAPPSCPPPPSQCVYKPLRLKGGTASGCSNGRAF